jgi:hypothetical protein
MDVKQALLDGRFRDDLPLEIREDVVKYLQCPSCSGNMSLYKKVLSTCQEQLRTYFPGGEIALEPETIVQPNNWSVINCKISELESKLKALPKGRKQLSVARYQDDVTVIVNEID